MILNRLRLLARLSIGDNEETALRTGDRMSMDIRKLVDGIAAHHGMPQRGSAIQGVVGEVEVLLDTRRWSLP